MIYLVQQGEVMINSRIDQSPLIPSVLKVTASSSLDITQELNIPDINQISIEELLNEEKEQDKEESRPTEDLSDKEDK